VKLSRVAIGLALAAAASLTSAADMAVAQDYPTKPVTLIMPFAAGGSNDILGRYLADKLSEKWGQPMVVENMPGAGSAIGTAHVAQSTPDGYTLAAGSVSFTMNPAVWDSAPYDPAKDLQPVALIGRSPLVLLVGKTVPANNMEEFVAFAKTKNLKYATSGVGSIGHFAGALLSKSAGITMTPVHYKGGAEALVDMIGGHVDLFLSSLPQALPHIKSGALRGLAVASATRADTLPDVPTLAEAGLTGAEIEQWFAVFAPAETPNEVVAKLNADINAVLETQETKDLMSKDGSQPAPGSVEQFSAMVHDELEKWKLVAADANIKAQ
jgi:tripartite-type tricarboxylate transporter receptor subunit TctC